MQSAHVGRKLALTGHDVTLILRGANLAAVQQNGLRLIEEDGKELLAHPHQSHIGYY
ncbi:MAG: 2-dehydropantoate 2-reductase N-terminal domain-containing protein [Nitrosomonadales bacterium]